MYVDTGTGTGDCPNGSLSAMLLNLFKVFSRLTTIQCLPRILASDSLFRGVKNSIRWGLRGRVLDSRPRGRGFEPHRCHCVVVLEQDTFILV